MRGEETAEQVIGGGGGGSSSTRGGTEGRGSRGGAGGGARGGEERGVGPEGKRSVTDAGAGGAGSTVDISDHACSKVLNLLLGGLTTGEMVLLRGQELQGVLVEVVGELYDVNRREYGGYSKGV